MATYPEKDAANALCLVLGQSRWVGVTLALGYLALAQGVPPEDVARRMFEKGGLTLRKCREYVGVMPSDGFLALLALRTRTGSAENPISKLFPATITEQRFIARLEDLRLKAPGVDYDDERGSGHTLVDFALSQNELRLPINVKNAGTRFENAQPLVGLDPDDCIPIPAYKAHAAVDREPNLVYAVAVDYSLVPTLNELLPSLFTAEEGIVWGLLNKHSGTQLRDAEDLFINSITQRHWGAIAASVADIPFRVISARKAIRILNTQPHRTPGIGLRAWGTGASAEVNVHISVAAETTPWETVADRILANGVSDIVSAVNRRRQELVYDPEI